MQYIGEIFLALACDAAAPFVSANVSVWHDARGGEDGYAPPPTRGEGKKKACHI